MELQFIYHPENDAVIAEQIIESSGIAQNYSLKKLKISDINTPNDELLHATSNSDVIVLLIGSTFDRIAPYIWFNALQNRKGILGVNIHTIPDEWGETRKKSATPGTEGTCEDGKTVNLFTIYDIPDDEEGISYISKNLRAWSKKAKESADNNYEIT